MVWAWRSSRQTCSIRVELDEAYALVRHDGLHADAATLVHPLRPLHLHLPHDAGRRVALDDQRVGRDAIAADLVARLLPSDVRRRERHGIGAEMLAGGGTDEP